MNILLLFTGGTIGSSLQNDSLAPDINTQYTLVDHYQSLHTSSSVHFTIASPLQILSEHLQPSHWSTIIESIESFNLSEIDGIIVTHGTDTLAV